MIQQTARGSHDDLGILLELALLLHDRLSTVEAGNAHAGNKAGQGAQLFGDLQAQLAGGSQHQFLHALVAQVDVLQHGNAEGAGFTGTRGGDGNDVPALHHQGQGFGLHGGHFGKTHLFNGFDDFFTQIRLGEFHSLDVFQNGLLLTVPDILQWHG